MHITIKTYTDTRNMEVPQTESALYKAIGEQLLNLSVPNRLLVSTPVGEAEFDVKQRGTFAKDGTIYPSMYVTEEYNTIQLPQDTYPEAYLTCINPVSNNYKFYHFRPSGSVLNATYGRIGAGRGEAFGKKDLKTLYPIHLYWIRYYEKLSKGYKDESSIYLAPAVSETPAAPTIPDQRPEAIELYQKLYTYAKGMVEQHLVHHDKVTVEQVSQSKKILAELSTKTTLKDFNETLQKLLTISPRKSRYVKSLLAVKTSDFPAIIDRENDLITAMEVMRPSGSIGSFREHNIHVFEATDSQRQEVIEHLTPSLQRKVRKIWRVIPDRQQKTFNSYCKEHHIRYVRQMWHGSRNANWLSITENSIKILPSYENGRMFGDGVYFALNPNKSFLYTSSSSAKYTNEHENVVYMGLFAVAYGKPLYVESSHHFTPKELEAKKKNCVHAKAGRSLKEDEIIFYSEAAMVMNYLVEFDA